MFGFLAGQAYGILPPWSGIESSAPALEGKVVTTGSPGKSLTHSCITPWIPMDNKCEHVIMMIHSLEMKRLGRTQRSGFWRSTFLNPTVCPALNFTAEPCPRAWGPLLQGCSCSFIHSFRRHWAGNFLTPEQPQPLGIQRQAPHTLCPQEPHSLRGHWSPKWENVQQGLCTVTLGCKEMGRSCYFRWFLPNSYQDLGN